MKHIVLKKNELIFDLDRGATYILNINNKLFVISFIIIF